MDPVMYRMIGEDVDAADCTSTPMICYHDKPHMLYGGFSGSLPHPHPIDTCVLSARFDWKQERGL